MFKQLQKDHKTWAFNNFGEQDVNDYALGLIEEVGKLAHSVLKRKQGIRNTEDHDSLIRDAIGDITIYLVGFCTGYNKELTHSCMDLVKGRGDSLAHCLILISINMNRVIVSKADFTTVIELIESLMQFCFTEGIYYEQVVKETWTNVVFDATGLWNDAMKLSSFGTTGYRKALNDLEKLGVITMQGKEE